VGLAGKGVTFDTGGISLKNSANLHYLKCDMAGGAAVIGTLEGAARLRLPVHLIGIVPATDNKPDGSALNPGDVINTYARITVEVEDTDAEGRLILADGLAYLKKHFNPDVMIDLATLTGASVISLGTAAAALFTNDDNLAGKLSAAADKTGEKVWRFPLWDEYNKVIDSTIADVKNYGGPPAGAITAAKFLEKFIDGHPAWAHLDIAGVAFTDSDFAKGKSSTAYGVRLLLEYLSEIG
jgi:leucyl aminopeptidase